MVLRASTKTTWAMLRATVVVVSYELKFWINDSIQINLFLSVVFSYQNRNQNKATVLVHKKKTIIRYIYEISVEWISVIFNRVGRERRTGNYSVK